MVRAGAPHATPENVADLRRLIEAQRERLGDPAAFIRADIDFHVRSRGLSGNRILPAVSEAMLGWLFRFHSDLLIWSGHEEVTLAEHAGIVDAIEAHDPERRRGGDGRAPEAVEPALPAPAMTRAALPEGLLVAWYGDDFTGSAAVMEVLTFAGLPSVLFLDLPTPAQLARFARLRGIGIASTARAHGPGLDGRPPARGLRHAARPRSADQPLQDVLDARLLARGRLGRPRHRPRARRLHLRLDADPRRRAAHAPLPGLRQPLRLRRPAASPARPPPGDGPAPGHADGRGRRRRATSPARPTGRSGSIDLEDLADPRPRERRPRRRSRAGRGGRRPRPHRRRDPRRLRPPDLGGPRRRASSR